MSTEDQILSSELHGQALLTARRPELQPLVDHLLEVAQERDDIRTECAGTIAGSWFASAARRDEDLIAAGLLMLAGPVDLDELDRWMRIGWERGRRADIPYGAGILRNVTRGLDLVFGFDSTLIEPPDETPPLVRVHWPLRPTTAAANHYPAVAAAIVRTHHR